jgi:hypothetical protein
MVEAAGFSGGKSAGVRLQIDDGPSHWPRIKEFGFVTTKKTDWTGKAAMAGAAIGSAALAAALLYASRRKESAEAGKAKPTPPADPVETD